MRYITFILLLVHSLSLFSQQKGVSPLKTQNSELKTSETYAVVVGISDYQNEGIPDLRFADRDAMAFADYLRSPAGGNLDEGHLKLLLNAEATMAQFAIALDWLMEKTNEGDKAIIYFSGHGDVEKRSLTQPGFLLCWDAPARVYMAGGAFPLPYLQVVISTISVQNKAKIIMVADACRSGKLSGSSVGGAQITGSNLAKQYANEIKILSCQPDEYSIEGEQWGGGRGAFSYHLLDGLYGMADNNKDLKVDLREIDRFLEDKVSSEVAPHRQFPLTVGNKAEKLADVFPDLLEQLKEGRKGQLKLFNPTETRGVEDEVLVTVDSAIVELYAAFKKALLDKHFFTPETACAEYFYNILSNEPQLKELHNSMRRNYAAALQDDTQQELNLMLTTGLTEQILTGRTKTTLYKDYPKYLERAAELLGPDHYMFDILQARKYYFIGKLEDNNEEKRIALQEALKWQTGLPHALLEIANAYSNLDSAEVYALQAAELIPSWASPYITLASHQLWFEAGKAKTWLEKAALVDSNSVELWYLKGLYSMWHHDLETAEHCYQRALDNLPTDVTFPAIYFALGNLFLMNNQPAKAELQFKECLRIDEKFLVSFAALGEAYLMQEKWEDAEQVFKRAIEVSDRNHGEQMDDIYIRNLTRGMGSNVLEICVDEPAFNLWEFYIRAGQPEQADFQLKKMEAKEIIDPLVYFRIGEVLYLEGKEEKAEYYFKKSHEMHPEKRYLGWFYLIHGDYEKAKYYLEKAKSAPNDYSIHSLYNLAWLDYSFGKKEEAIKLLNDLVEKEGINDFNIIGHRLIFSAFVEPPQKSKANFEVYAQTNPKIMEVWDCIQLMKSSQYEKAEDAYHLLVNDVIEWWVKRYLRLAFVIMKIKQGEYETAVNIMDSCRLDHYTFNYPLLTSDPDFEPLWELESFKGLINKYFPEKNID